jgi:hypothetical protein
MSVVCYIRKCVCVCVCVRASTSAQLTLTHQPPATTPRAPIFSDVWLSLPLSLPPLSQNLSPLPIAHSLFIGERVCVRERALWFARVELN